MPAGKTCYFWLNGGACAKGDSCGFLHSGTIASPPWKNKVPAPPTLRERPVDPVKLMADTGLLLESIDALTLTESEKDSGLLTDYEFLSSFNWVERATPTIFVPGSPSVWLSKDLPFRVPKDQGTFFVDQNSARCPENPADALFRSLAIMRPDFSMRDVDLVTDRNCLRKLLRFIARNTDISFRIDINIVGGVMIFRRWEEETSQTVRGLQHIGYGYNFEAESTAFDPDLAGSRGHHRVVRYRLGGLNCVLRFEANSHCRDPAAVPQATGSEAKERASPEIDLVEKLQALPTDDRQDTEAVEVIRSGRTVPLSSIVEIKTRSIKKLFQIKDVIPQLWLSQTPYLYLGYHNAGNFERVDKHAMSAEYARWEDDHQEQIRKLVGLLKKLREIAEGVEGKRCVVACEAGSEASSLKVYESAKKNAVLSEEVMKLHKWS
ncbi:MAG: hypothetical protein M1840_006574 [Geoglossum simile]|nr:MAG: hypothetical protein M1840_006574 [Geoglossum simile]